MRITTTTTVADRVATAVRAQLTGVEGPEGNLYPFLNGRERGWFLSFWTWAANDTAWAFAEARGSGRIVVYVVQGWNMYDPTPDRMWRTCAYFDTPAAAAQHIATLAREEIAQHRDARARESQLAEAIAATN